MRGPGRAMLGFGMGIKGAWKGTGMELWGQPRLGWAGTAWGQEWDRTGSSTSGSAELGPSQQVQRFPLMRNSEPGFVGWDGMGWDRSSGEL